MRKSSICVKMQSSMLLMTSNIRIWSKLATALITLHIRQRRCSRIWVIRFRRI